MDTQNREKRIFRVRVNRPSPARYYAVSESSGCPSASFRVPYGAPGSRIIIRDNR